MKQSLFKIGSFLYWCLYAGTFVYFALSWASCTKDKRKNCYTCITATKYAIPGEKLNITRDTEIVCDKDIYLYEQSKTKHWESNDTVYNTSAKCIQ